MNDEEFFNKILAIFVSFIYIFIALFTLFIIGVSSVDAATTGNFKSWGCGNDVDSSGFDNSYTYRTCYGGATWLNVDFPKFAGAFQSHAKIEFQFNDSNNSVGYKSINVLVYVDGIPHSDGVSASCPVSGNTATCDIYYNGLFTSEASLIIQLQLTGSYFRTNMFRARVSGSYTFDSASAGLNNGSFQQGINSIITNQNQNKQDIINNQNKNTQDIINGIKDGKLDDNSAVNDDKLNDYQDAENNLIDKDALNNINNIEITLDSNSNSFIWELVTKIIQTHSLIFGLVITMLSLGILKLVLNR